MKINDKVKSGLRSLIKNDAYLLINNLNERSITHKLAEHYQDIFSSWNVDCEYNRNLGDEKKILIDPNILLAKMANTLEINFYKENINSEAFSYKEIRNLENQLRNPEVRYDEELEIAYFILKLTNGKIIEKTIYPDIIVHKRGTSDNHIVIEVKKTNNLNREARLFDIVKLLTLVKSPDFKYKKGFFIDLPVGSDFKKLEEFDFKQNYLDSKVYEVNPIYS